MTENTTRDTRQDLVDALQESLRRAVIQRDQAEEIASNAMTRNAALVGALQRYGRHKSWCAGCDPAKQDDFCTCGLNDALALGTGAVTERSEVLADGPTRKAGNAQSPRSGSQGDSAHTPKGGNDA